MTVENVDYIADLDSSHPDSSEYKTEGAAHLRNLKEAVQKSFPGFAGAVLVTGEDVGTANTYVINPTTPLVSYTANTIFVWKAANASTGACTLNVSSLGAKTIQTVAGAALTTNDILAGQYVAAAYDGTNLRLLGVTKNYADQLAFTTALPAQAGNSGKFLTSNGAAASWATIVSGISTVTTYSGSPTGTFSRAASKTGTYSQAGTTTVNATIVAHGLAVGDRIYLDFTSGTGADGWTTVVTVPTADTFTCVRTSLTTSGNVTMYPPIVVTITSQAAHGVATSGMAYVDFSGTYTDGSYPVYQATTSTFQVEPTGATTAIGSGTVSFLSVSKTATYTKPAGLVAARVTVVPGGGQGAIASTGGGNGGYGGGYAQKVLAAASIGATETLTIGYGGCTTVAGVSAAAGQAGGASSFGALLSVTGAPGGTTAAVTANTSIGVGGDLNIPGYPPQVAISGAYSGSGAHSAFGAGGTGSTDGANGNDASGYGAGGSGAFTTGAAVRGGKGAGGLIIVEEFF
jgi:hypothetical protein